VQGGGPEDTVVTAGQLKLRDGVPVRVAGASVTAASADGPAVPGGVRAKDEAEQTRNGPAAPGTPKS